MRFLVVFGLVAALSGGAELAAAQDAPKGQIVLDAPPPARPPADAELFMLDSAVFKRALAAPSLADLAKLEPELKAVVEHAPAEFRLFQARPGQVTVRADRDAAMPVVRALAEAQRQAAPDKPVNVSFEPNVYGGVALLLVSLQMDRKDYAAALSTLGNAASYQPDNPKILAARANAMAMLGQLPEAMSVYLSWRRDFKLQAELSPTDTAMMHRGIGSVMTKQGRLYDAEAAYEAALKLEPRDQIAANELASIKRLQAGQTTAAP